MDSINELEAYLVENCFSFQALTIGKHFAPEGIIIEKENGKFCFSYSERGRKNIIKAFETEKELVEYSLLTLKNDKWAKAHLAAMTFSAEEIREAEKKLKRMNIEFVRNDIPNYHIGVTAFRIFVFGKDILKLDDFKKTYLHILR